MAIYEDENNFRPIFNTAISLMRSRGQSEYCDLIIQAEVSVVNTEYDNWNGGTYGYTVSVNLPVKMYASLSKESVEVAEKTLAETLNEVNKGDDNNYFAVQIAPVFTKADTDWSIIGGESAREQMKKDLAAMKDIMISVATGGPNIKDVDDRYRVLHNGISRKCKQLRIKYENGFSSLWDWYGRWRSDMPHYQQRRDFINELLKPTLEAFETSSGGSSITMPIVDWDEWERIKRTIIKIKMNSGSAQNEEDYQQVGLLCREVIISLAQVAYNPTLHGIADEKGTTIGKTDAVRMIGNYLNVTLSGSSNEELRQYAKATNKLANLLTHKRDATKKDMMMAVSATIALINFIGILEGKI